MAIDPQTVTAPLKRLEKGSLRVIHKATDPIEIDWALAIGIFDGRRALLVRWSGDSPMGNPVAHGRPTWFVLPNDLHAPILAAVPEPHSSDAHYWLNGGNPTNWVD
jgi:hypothetical protein